MAISIVPKNPPWRKTITSILLHEQPMNPGLFMFDQLLTEWLPGIIDQYGTLETQFRLTEKNITRDRMCRFRMHNCRVIPGQRTPREAFLENQSYMADVVVDIDELSMESRTEEQKTVVEQRKVKHHLNHYLCSIPVSMHSIACSFRNGFVEKPLDAHLGTVFIIAGHPRFIPMTQRLRHNREYDFHVAAGKRRFEVEVRSEHRDRKHRSTSTLNLHLNKSRADGDVKNLKKMVQGWQLFCNIPFLRPKIPMYILMRSLGWTAEDFVTAMRVAAGPTWDEKRFYPIVSRFMLQATAMMTQKDALRFICEQYGKRDANDQQLQSQQNTLRSEILPHLNQDSEEQTNFSKGMMLAHLCVELIRLALGLKKPTDRDAYPYLCIEDSASLLAQLFRFHFKKFMTQAATTSRRMLKNKRPLDINKIFNQSRLTYKLRTAMATGKWSEKRKSVSHQLNISNLFAVVSQMRQVSTSFLNTDGKHLGPRMTHPTSTGYTCTFETPEGEKCGLVLTCASLTILSEGSDPVVMTELLRIHVNIHPLSFENPPPYPTACKFFGPTGEWLGWVEDGTATVHHLRRLRRRLILAPDVSIWLENQGRELHVDCTRGRLLRPLIILENLPKLTHVDLQPGLSRRADLLMAGIWEYVGSEEEYAKHKATRVCPVHHVEDAIPGIHTHLIISDSDFLGVCASLVPFVQHNQGPRIVYEVGMMKQAVEQEAFTEYGAPTKFILHHGQRPLVFTETARQLNLHKRPNGINVIAAIYPDPFNQEDALVVNQAAVDRGLFRTSCIRTYDVEKRPSEPDSVFCKPDPARTFGRRAANYDHLQDDGLPCPGDRIRGGDVLIGKAIDAPVVSNTTRANVPEEFKSEEYQEHQRDVSKQARVVEKESSVFQVMVAPNVRKTRIITKTPLIRGDKLSSMYGQKGTVGALRKPEDMPFSMKTGMIPDLLISPESLTSRMTCGVLLELLTSKAITLSGMVELGLDEQFFERASHLQRKEKLKEILRKHGYNAGGTEIMIDGCTGEQIQCPIMMGPIFFNPLSHKVSRKAYARSVGAVQTLTRQPVEGRRRGGGLRFGSMEGDCVAAHGVSSMMRERMLELSDAFDVYICNGCGNVADANMQLNIIPPWCRVCATAANIYRTRMSRSSMVMFDELMATGIKTSFSLTAVQTGNIHVFRDNGE